MKVINLNSRFELTPAQISFAEAVMIGGDRVPSEREDSFPTLMNELPVFLVDEGTQEEYGKGDLLGFYHNSERILGLRTPVIGLCLDRIVKAATTEEELSILIATVLIHEFAHARMDPYPQADYYPIDEFYKWMEEPIANMITLECFDNFDHRRYRFRFRKHKRDDIGIHFAHINTHTDPLDFVKRFISTQPDNYRLGLDLFKHRYILHTLRVWPRKKESIQKKTKEKNDWLVYVKEHVGKTDEDTLKKLIDALE